MTSNVLRLSSVGHVVQSRRNALSLACTNGFHVKANDERFTALGSRCRENLKYENFYVVICTCITVSQLLSCFDEAMACKHGKSPLLPNYFCCFLSIWRAWLMAICVNILIRWIHLNDATSRKNWIELLLRWVFNTFWSQLAAIAVISGFDS